MHCWGEYGLAKSGFGKLKDLMDLAGKVSPEDVERLKKRAETIEQSLQKLLRIEEEQVRLLKQILEEVRRLAKAK